MTGEHSIELIKTLLREAARIEVLPLFGRAVAESKKDYADFKEIVTEADI